jgi:hypothetical protein
MTWTMLSMSHPIAVVGSGPIGIITTARLLALDQTYRIPALAEADGDRRWGHSGERESLASTQVPVHMGATTGKRVWFG